LDPTHASDCVRAVFKNFVTESSVPSIQTLKDHIELAKSEMDRIKQIEKLHKTKLAANDVAAAEQLTKNIDEIKLNMIEVNERFVHDAAKILETEGISTTTYKEKEFLILQLNLDKVPKGNRALKTYKKIKDRYGVDKITVNLSDNILKKRVGVYSGSQDRVEIGYQEIFNILEGKAGITAKHELRHGIFNHKKEQNIPSTYQVRFYASLDERYLLNQKNKYETYMSSEELYNWSTDLQTLAQQMKSVSGDDTINLLEKITSKNNGLMTIAETSSDVSEVMIKKLKSMMSEKDFSRISLGENRTVIVTDDLGRRTELSLIGTEREKLISNLQRAQNSQSKLVSAQMDIANYAVERLEELKLVGEAQKMEGKRLVELIQKYTDPTNGGKVEQLNAVKEQMFKMAKNVKEHYKGSVLNSRK
jgi:hypothetical protein